MKTKLLLSFYVLLIYQISLQAQTSWSLTGNAGTNPPTNFLGTTDNKALVLKTNKVERMRLTNTGNVGIGITNPSQKLDINGNINIANGSGIYINHTKIL